VILDLRLAGVESERAWLATVQSLVERKLGAPALAVIDGDPGLAAALTAQWPKLAIQRCTNHKLWNLLAKAPAHLREELAEDYRCMICAERRGAVEQARRGFARKWKLRCQAVYASFEEAGDELFYLHCLSGRAMESAAHHQRTGTDQRGVSPSHQDSGLAAERGGGFVSAVWAAAQRSDQSAPADRMAETRLQ
jgi:mutator family transposase